MLKRAFSVPTFKAQWCARHFLLAFWGRSSPFPLVLFLKDCFYPWPLLSSGFLIIFDQREALARDRERQKTSEIEVLIAWAFPLGSLQAGCIFQTSSYTPQRNRHYPWKGHLVIKEKESEMCVMELWVAMAENRDHMWQHSLTAQWEEDKGILIHPGS